MRVPRIAFFLTLALLFGNALVAVTVHGVERGALPDPPLEEGGAGDEGDGGGGHGGGGDDEEDDDDSEERHRRPWYSSMHRNDPAPVQERYAEWGLGRSLDIPQWAFDPDGTGRWERRDRTAWWLEEECPRDWDGPLCIDWEHGVYEHLRNGPDDLRFGEIVAEMVRLAEYIKSQRPQAQVGYWGVPLSRTWDQDETWREASYALQPVYDVSDALFIQVYDHRRDDPTRDEQLAEVVRFALELAQDKPVILYTWHRYHSWTPEYGFSIIPRAEQIAHIRKFLSVEYGGKRVHGAIAWGATDWYYEEAFEVDEEGEYVRQAFPWDQIRDAFKAEMHPGETIDQYVARLHPKLYDRLAAAATE